MRTAMSIAHSGMFMNSRNSCQVTKRKRRMRKVTDDEGRSCGGNEVRLSSSGFGVEGRIGDVAAVE